MRNRTINRNLIRHKEKHCPEMRNITALIAVLGLYTTAWAQQTYTLEACTKLALEQNLQIKSTQLNSDKFTARKGETTAAYLPQVNFSGDYSYYFEVPTQVIPAEAFGGLPGQYIPAQFGLKQSISAGFEASQLLYNQQLINGLKLLNIGRNITLLQVVKTKEDVAYNVAATYYNLENVYLQSKFAQDNMASIEKLRNTTKSLYEAGVAGRSDLDRLSVTLNNIQSGYDNLQIAKEQLYRYLKFLMNIDLNTPIIIDTTNITQAPEVQILTTGGEVDRTDVKLAQNQMQLLKQQRKSTLAAYIPTLAAYGGLNYTGYNPDFKFFGTFNGKFYPASLVGINLSIPIFDGLKNKYVGDQLKLDYKVAETNLQLLQSSINMDVAKGVENYNLQYKQSLLLGDNLEVATRVYNDLQNRYQQGLVGISDLLTAETSLREAQNNYSGALIKLKSALLEYNKAVGTILEDKQ